MTSKNIGASSPVMREIIVLLLVSPFVTSLKFSSKYSDKAKQVLFELDDKVTTNEINIGDDNFRLENMFNHLIKHRSEELNIIFKNITKNYGSFKQVWPLISDCVEYKGVSDCLKIFLLRRIQRVESTMKDAGNVSIVFDDLPAEILKNFKWEDYKTVPERELDKILLKQLKGFAKNKSIKLFMRPGIDLQFTPMGDGSLKLDISKDPDLQLPRGMKGSKMFYTIVPFLLIPPLIMSAILPFILPAMKMMVLASGMINQLALGGAIFSLMRNGIFQDKYEEKVVYVNDGYKNEHKPPPIVHHENLMKHPAFHLHHEPQIKHHQDSYHPILNTGHHEIPHFEQHEIPHHHEIPFQYEIPYHQDTQFHHEAPKYHDVPQHHEIPHHHENPIRYHHEVSPQLIQHQEEFQHHEFPQHSEAQNNHQFHQETTNFKTPYHQDVSHFINAYAETPASSQNQESHSVEYNHFHSSEFSDDTIGNREQEARHRKRRRPKNRSTKRYGTDEEDEGISKTGVLTK